jgi:hypothetical protein
MTLVGGAHEDPDRLAYVSQETLLERGAQADDRADGQRIIQ